MKTTVALMLCILVPMAVFSGDNGYKVTYDGGSLPMRIPRSRDFSFRCQNDQFWPDQNAIV